MNTPTAPLYVSDLDGTLLRPDGTLSAYSRTHLNQLIEDLYLAAEEAMVSKQNNIDKLNKRIDLLVDALKQADQMMAKMGDQKGIIEQINQKKAAKAKKGAGQAAPERKSIAEFFKEQINRK